MFVCDRVVTYFDVEKTLGMSSYQIWDEAHLYKADRSRPFMIDGTHYFSWGESQGLTNVKL